MAIDREQIEKFMQEELRKLNGSVGKHRKGIVIGVLKNLAEFFHGSTGQLINVDSVASIAEKSSETTRQSPLDL